MKEVKAPKIEKKKRVNSKFIPKPERIITASELELMELKVKNKKKINKKIVITSIIAGLLLAWAITMTVLFVKEYKFNDGLLIENYNINTELYSTKAELEGLKRTSKTTEAKYDMCLDTLTDYAKILEETEDIAVDLWNYWYEGRQRSDSGDYFRTRLYNVQDKFKNLPVNQI